MFSIYFRRAGQVVLGAALLSGVVSCATLSNLSHKVGLKSSLPSDPLRIQELTSYQLTSLNYLMTDTQLHSEKAWQWRGRNALGAPPQSFIPPKFLGGDEVLIATLGGGIGIYRLQSSAAKWKVEIPIGVAAEPLVEGSFVYVAGMDAYVRKLRLDNGSEVWKSKLTAESLGGIVAAHGFLYVTAADDSLWALDENTGTSKWSYKRPSPDASVYWSLRGQATPILNKDASRIFVGFSDGVFVALDSVGGQTVWERNFDRSGRFKDADLQASYSENLGLLFLPLVDGDLVALKTIDGSTLWNLPRGGGATPFVDEKEGFLYASTLEGALQKVSLKDGKIAWEKELSKRGILSTPTPMFENYLAVSSNVASLMVLNRSTGELLYEKDLGSGSLAQPSFDGRRLLVISERNLLHIYRVEERFKGKSS